MFDSKFFDGFKRVSSGGKGSSEDVEQLFIKTSNPHILNCKIRSENAFFIALGRDVKQRPWSSFQIDLSFRQQFSNQIVASSIVTSHHVHTLGNLCAISGPANNHIFGLSQVKESVFFFGSQSFKDLERLNFCGSRKFRDDLVDLNFQEGEIMVNLILLTERFNSNSKSNISPYECSQDFAHAYFISFHILSETALDNFSVDLDVDCLRGIFRKLGRHKH